MNKSKTRKRPKEFFTFVIPLKSEEWEKEDFYCEVSGDLIFIWGGGMESCVSKRVMKIFVKWMREQEVI